MNLQRFYHGVSSRDPVRANWGFKLRNFQPLLEDEMKKGAIRITGRDMHRVK